MSGAVPSDRTIFVVSAIDDSFATPLLVTLRSACRNLSAGWRIESFVVGLNVSAESRARVESALAGMPIDVRWLELDLTAIAEYWPGILCDAHLTCYYRLFLGEALPESVERVLFLDADLLVHGDLAVLWNRPFDGAIAQAVPDAYARLLHTRRLSRIRFSEGVSFSEETPYFNAGVLLIDLRRWREERIGNRASAFLWKYGEQLGGRDQDALNCALAGQWKRLPPTWNFHELPEHADSWDYHGATREELREAAKRPAIRHFIGWKPWGRAWRPVEHKQWWAEARAAGVPPVRRIVHVAIWDALLFSPHVRLKWHIRRREWSRIPVLLLTRPWIAVSYPIWRAAGR